MKLEDTATGNFSLVTSDVMGLGVSLHCPDSTLVIMIPLGFECSLRMGRLRQNTGSPGDLKGWEFPLRHKMSREGRSPDVTATFNPAGGIG